MRKTSNVLWLWQLCLALFFIFSWWLLTTLGVLDPFFFGEPIKVFSRIISWFSSGMIWKHIGITLLETFLSFIIGAISGLLCGMWLAFTPFISGLLAPYIKAANVMPRIVLAPIFSIWFGLGIWSKVALGVTLVFFIVFFNSYQAVRELNPTLIANAKMLGASKRQLFFHIYLPSATSWVFSGLHTSIGMAFVGSVVAEYMGSEHGIGYLILQAEGIFDIDSVLAGIFILTVFAVALDHLISIAEHRLLKWQPRAHSN